MYIYYKMVDSPVNGERLDHLVNSTEKANTEEQKLDSYLIHISIIKIFQKDQKCFKKLVKVLKNLDKTLSTTVLGKDFLSISPWMEIINEVSQL